MGLCRHEAWYAGSGKVAAFLLPHLSALCGGLTICSVSDSALCTTLACPQVGFIRNREDRVVFDRAFNTASMLSHYYG